MSSLYVGLDVFCPFEARISGFGHGTSLTEIPGKLVYITAYSGTLDSNILNASSPIYNDDISYLMR
jgi:hypothetical protein